MEKEPFMELFDYYLRYMTELLEGKRPAPEGILSLIHI